VVARTTLVSTTFIAAHPARAHISSSTYAQQIQQPIAPSSAAQFFFIIAAVRAAHDRQLAGCSTPRGADAARSHNSMRRRSSPQQTRIRNGFSVAESFSIRN
jgi:hypothetical protein